MSVIKLYSKYYDKCIMYEEGLIEIDNLMTSVLEILYELSIEDYEYVEQTYKEIMSKMKGHRLYDKKE